MRTKYRVLMVATVTSDDADEVPTEQSIKQAIISSLKKFFHVRGRIVHNLEVNVIDCDIQR